jgi:hypothetical protein
MGTNPTATTRAAVTVRRVRRTELGPVFALIQGARGGQLPTEDIVQKAIGYGYLVAEVQDRIIGVAGMLVENSVACVRDLLAASTSMRGLSTVALMDAIEIEAGGLACEAVIVQVPKGTSVVEALLRDRRYEPKKLSELKGLWREVASEQFEATVPLWVTNLRLRDK